MSNNIIDLTGFSTVTPSRPHNVINITDSFVNDLDVPLAARVRAMQNQPVSFTPSNTPPPPKRRRLIPKAVTFSVTPTELINADVVVAPTPSALLLGDTLVAAAAPSDATLTKKEVKMAQMFADAVVDSGLTKLPPKNIVLKEAVRISKEYPERLSKNGVTMLRGRLDTPARREAWVALVRQLYAPVAKRQAKALQAGRRLNNLTEWENFVKSSVNFSVPQANVQARQQEAVERRQREIQERLARITKFKNEYGDDTEELRSTTPVTLPYNRAPPNVAPLRTSMSALLGR